MKKIVKFLSLLLVMLLSVSQMAWAESDVYMPDFAKASAKVSTKSNGQGTVYVFSENTIDWEMAGRIMSGAMEDGDSLEEALRTNSTSDVTADMSSESEIDKEVVGLYGMLSGIGTAPTICAKFLAFPANGYYLKGWSKTDNQYDLGAGALEQCILTEARLIPVLKGMPSGDNILESVSDVIIPKPSEYPDMGTYYATFAPVQINACTAGNKAYINAGESYDTEASFDLTFSTTYADNAFDFAAPKLTYVDAEGVRHYTDAQGRLSVQGWGTFTLGLGSKIDLYINGERRSFDCFKTFAEQGVTESLYSKSVCDSRKGESVEQFCCNGQRPELGKQYFTHCRDIAYDIVVNIDGEEVNLVSNKTFSEQGYDKIYQTDWYDDITKSPSDYLCVSDCPKDKDEEREDGGYYAYFTQCFYFYNTYAIAKDKVSVVLTYHIKSSNGWKELSRTTPLRSDKTFAQQGFTELYTSESHQNGISASTYSCNLETLPVAGTTYYLNCYDESESGYIETEAELPTELEPIEGSLVNGVFFDHNEKFANLHIGFELEDTSDENHTQLTPGSELKLYVTLASAGGESSLTEPISLIVEEGSENEVLLSFGEGEPVGMSLMQAVVNLLSPEAPMDAEPTIKLMQPAVVSAMELAPEAYISAVFARNCTIDLNGQEISNDGDLPAMFVVCNNATLTIEDSKGDGRIVLSREASSSSVNEHVFAVASGYPGATELAAAAGMQLSSDNGHVVLNGGEIRGNQYNTLDMEYPYGAGAVVVTPASTFTMNGGKVTSISDMQNACGVANMGGEVTINGGALIADAAVSTASAVWNMAGDLHINGGSLSATSLYGSVGVMMGVMPGMEAPVESDENGLYPTYATADIKKATISATATNANDFNSDYLAAGIMLTNGTSITLTEKPSISGTMPNSVNMATAIALFDGRIGLNINGAKLSASNSTGNLMEFLPIGGLDNVTLNVDAIYTVDHEILDNCLLYMSMKDEEYGTSYASMYKIYGVGAGKEYNEGYRYLFGTAQAAESLPICKIGNSGFSSLKEAFLFAQNNPDKNVPIIMLKDYTLPAGYYTLPANATLLVPYSASQVAPMNGNVKKVPYQAADGGYETPYPHCKLTLAAGAHLDAYGSIEASAMQYINGHADDGNAVPSGGYGWIYMEEGSDIILEDGAHLYAWGFVTGKGTIDARRGSYVHEDFQVYDWPGASAALGVLLNAINTETGAFPVNQYFMQNVESPITFHPGSRMFASFGASASMAALGSSDDQGIQVAADAIQIVGVTGDVAMFLLDDDADADNTWVRKHYDIENDQQVWEVNSSAHLGSMFIELPAFKLVSGIMEAFKDVPGFDTRNFVLPITSNMKLHLLSGLMDITQNTEFLPGAELEVNKTSTMTILDDPEKNYDGRVVFMDNDEWEDDYGCVTPFHQIRYSPTFDATLGSTLGDGNGRPNVRNLTRDESSDKKEVGDAKLNVHGTFQVDGYLMTSEGGASIISNNADAGTINYPNGYEAISMVVRHNGADEIAIIDLYPAKLKNEVPTPAFAETGTSTQPGDTYCFMNNRWTKTKQYDNYFVYDNYGSWYIKPGEYVTVATKSQDSEGYFASATFEDTENPTEPLENDDHTYSDAAGEGRLFIQVENKLDGGFQWWEVKLKDNLYRGVKNGTYYYYDEGHVDPEDEDSRVIGWVEKTFNITFVNWDGSVVLDAKGEECVYALHYGDGIKFNGTNPTRENTPDKTYTFAGWSPAITASTVVTGEAVYTATFLEENRKYLVTFLDAQGDEIADARQFLTLNTPASAIDVPEIEVPVGYKLWWEPAIASVTGDAEYRAVVSPLPKENYTIKFVNYDGEVLDEQTLTEGEEISYSGEIPTKSWTNSEFTFDFMGWEPKLTPGMTATEDITFTAIFEQHAQTATVVFKDEEGSTLKTVTDCEFGTTPEAPNHTKPATAEFSYATTWSPLVHAVTLSELGKTVVYQAVVTPTKNKYTVTVNATGCVVNGAGSYEYGIPVTLSLGDALSGYENPVWGTLPADYEVNEDNEIVFNVTDNVTISASASIKEPNPETPDAKVWVKNVTIGGEWTIGSEDEGRINKLVFEASVDEEGMPVSGAITNPEMLQMLTSEVYYQYTFNAQASTSKNPQWYAFGVPFKVNANSITNTQKTLTIENDYYIYRYDGAVRARDGKSADAWVEVKGTLEPGVFYLITFREPQTTVTFKAQGNSTYDYRNITVTEYPAREDSDEARADAGWNGIANPAMYSALLKNTVEYGQVYNAKKGSYVQVPLTRNDKLLASAAAVFVQVPASKSVTATLPEPVLPVAARVMAAPDNNQYVLIMSQNGNETDKVILRSSEEAEDRYVIGEDLAKAGVSSIVGQMWVNRYGAKLCVNNQAPVYDETTYPLGIFAPKAGNYTLNQTEGNSEYEVILMHNNVPVANLSRAAYTLALQKGNTEDYSVVIRRVVGGATDKVDVDGNVDVNKVLINGKLYILAGEHVYDALGQLVK